LHSYLPNAQWEQLYLSQYESNAQEIAKACPDPPRYASRFSNFSKSLDGKGWAMGMLLVILTPLFPFASLFLRMAKTQEVRIDLLC
jgi:hypothetical protein